MSNKLLTMIIEVQHVAAELDEDGTAFVVQTSAPSNVGKKQGGSAGPSEKVKKNWKKPKDMPRRPLSAYNLFFKSERLRMVSFVTNNTKPRQKGKREKKSGIGFAGMARTIASKWKAITSWDKLIFEEHAKVEKARYHKEISVWKKKQAAKNDQLQKKAPSKEASVKPGASAKTHIMGLANQHPFDASDNMVLSLLIHLEGMQDSFIMRRHQQLYQQENATLDTVVGCVPLPSLSHSPIVHPFGLTPNYPKIKQPSLAAPEPPSTCESADFCSRHAMSSTMSIDPFFPMDSGDKDQQVSAFDDLSLFMNIMEEGDW